MSAIFSAPVAAQGRIIDEGVFVVTQKGHPEQTESFKIAHLDNDLIQATGQRISGSERVTSSLVVDSLGAPVSYLFVVTQGGATTLTVRAVADAHRISMSSSDNRSNETMKDFPIVSGRTLILDDGLLHQLYFVALGERTGSLQLIRPRVAGRQSAVLTPRGLESIEVDGRSATATHYSLVAGATDIQFWVDAAGRVLRVTIPTQGLTATREELPH